MGDQAEGKREGMKKGDYVHCKAVPAIPGKIIRISEKGQWVDVDWFSHTKRLPLKALEKE